MAAVFVCVVATEEGWLAYMALLQCVVMLTGVLLTG